MNEPDWLLWARELQAIAQIGLTFVKDPFDAERFHQIRVVAAKMMAAHTASDLSRIEALFTEQTGYATPKVDVRAAVFRDDGALLMVREATDGKWSLPGGWAEVNQSARDAVIREVRRKPGSKSSRSSSPRCSTAPNTRMCRRAPSRSTRCSSSAGSPAARRAQHRDDRDRLFRRA